MSTPPPAWDSPRTAVVTGGGSGIGAATAKRLAAEGASVAIFDLDEASAQRVAGAITDDGGTAVGLGVDVSDRAQIDSAVAEVATAFDPPTILVNNAGLDGFDPFVEITAERWQRILAVNLTGTFDCCQAVVAHMVDAGWGRIVNISSSSAQTGNALMTHYASSKAGVIGLTRSLAQELGPKGLTVNVVAPGFIDTPMLRKTEKAGFLGAGVEQHEKTTPVRRVGKPEDIAAACAFLARDDSGYITGQVLGVNGGRVIS